MPDYWVYILSCTNNSYYTGYTVNLTQRYYAHVQGTAAKFTRGFKPQYLACSWPIYGSKRQAMQIERFIKKLDRTAKQWLIDNPMRLESLIIQHGGLNESD